MKRCLFLFLTVAAITLQLFADVEHKGGGLAPLSDKDKYHLENNVHKVISVKPNKMGVERIQTHFASQGLSSMDMPMALSAKEEFTTIQAPTEHALSMIGDHPPLPLSVDNSLLPCFPPIGNQRQIGSCVAWGSTYYQATHEIGLLNGNNNKMGFIKVLSPKWTYDLINGGYDQGSSVLDAYRVLQVNGAPSIVNFPYDNNYTAWDLNFQDWVAALSNRMSGYTLIPGLGGDGPQNLDAIKHTLNNGHVVTFATFIDSWVFTNIKTDPVGVNNKHVGEYAAYFMNGYYGGHFMTIVGYDDTLWIDVNHNGVVDAGERGAFLVANSWGTGWGNAGFIWISYDAFLAASAVTGGPHIGRVPAGCYLNSCVIANAPKAPNYTPSLVGKFSVTQTVRNQISLQAGVSSTSMTAPIVNDNISIVSYQGGGREFDGTNPSAAETLTFAADFTDLLKPSGMPNQRYYIVVTDAITGYPTTLNSFSLLDLVHNQEIHSLSPPKSYDHAVGSSFIDYNFSEGKVVGNPPPLVSISSPAGGATIQGTVPVTISAAGVLSIANVTFSMDGKLISTLTSAPYRISVDTTKLSNGTHQFASVATDTAGHTATTSIAVNVLNVVASPAIYINAGGPTLTSSGAAWKADTGYVTGKSATYGINKPFENLVYQTTRYGKMAYNFPVANGDYLVTLKFAEIYFKAPKTRVFNVLVNGIAVLTNLDVYAKAGYGNPYDATFSVHVTSKNISVQFIPVTDSPNICAIQIVPK